VAMGNNISVNSEKCLACGPQRERRATGGKTEEETCPAGRNIGYHLGYSHGYEYGFEKGYAEGSTIGYNNGFLAALKLEGWDDSRIASRKPEIVTFQNLQKLVAGGLIRIFLAGHAAGEAAELFRSLDIEAAVYAAGGKTNDIATF